MTPKECERASKFLSYILRHKPEDAGLILGDGGWVAVTSLLRGCKTAGYTLTREELDEVVNTNDKKRFQIESDCIRAVQGHSVSVDMNYKAVKPPAILYHGTATRFLASIAEHGLIRGSRNHVHLSETIDTAKTVGVRHGKPVVIPVKSGLMYTAGSSFFQAPNGVWLVDCVPHEYLDMDNLVY